MAASHDKSKMSRTCLVMHEIWVCRKNCFCSLIGARRFSALACQRWFASQAVSVFRHADALAFSEVLSCYERLLQTSSFAAHELLFAASISDFAMKKAKKGSSTSRTKGNDSHKVNWLVRGVITEGSQWRPLKAVEATALFVALFRADLIIWTSVGKMLFDT